MIVGIRLFPFGLASVTAVSYKMLDVRPGSALLPPGSMTPTLPVAMR